MNFKATVPGLDLSVLLPHKENIQSLQPASSQPIASPVSKQRRPKDCRSSRFRPCAPDTQRTLHSLKKKLAQQRRVLRSYELLLRQPEVAETVLRTLRSISTATHGSRDSEEGNQSVCGLKIRETERLQTEFCLLQRQRELLRAQGEKPCSPPSLAGDSLSSVTSGRYLSYYEKPSLGEATFGVRLPSCEESLEDECILPTRSRFRKRKYRFSILQSQLISFTRSIDLHSVFPEKYSDRLKSAFLHTTESLAATKEKLSLVTAGGVCLPQCEEYTSAKAQTASLLRDLLAITSPLAIAGSVFNEGALVSRSVMESNGVDGRRREGRLGRMEESMLSLDFECSLSFDIEWESESESDERRLGFFCLDE